MTPSLFPGRHGLLLLLSLPSVLLAGEADKGAPSPPPVLSGESLGEMVLGLMIVVALILALAWFFRRLGAGGALGSHGLKVVASLPLGTRERVVLVQAGSRQLLLGVAPGRVNLLKEYEQPLIDPQDGAGGGAFSQRLREALRGRAS